MMRESSKARHRRLAKTDFPLPASISHYQKAAQLSRTWAAFYKEDVVAHGATPVLKRLFPENPVTCSSSRFR